ncbi:MAG TPA: FtsX-like permease family protein [Mycobacteriales bacterium]|nr:FtsX-like permease family protein [Mycobacteriales bacterium]
MLRWAWRLFRREWRQQLLVLGLIVMAVAATIVGAAVATNTPPPANAGFGTAQDRATFPGADPHLAAEIAALQQRFGRVDVIENQIRAIPGSIDTYQLRAQNPDGPFGRPMLSLVSGHYPTGRDQVALTDGVASTFGSKVGDVWRQGGTGRRVVGIVENPQSLLSEFALVTPGQVTAPTEVTVLFDAPGVPARSLGPNVATPASVAQSNPLNPQTIPIAGLTLGMLLIALVATGGFTVLAQRRLRSLGMLESLGATDRHVGLVVRANGAVVGVVGALVGAVVGFAAWLAYRPILETSAHHLIRVFALPWLVIALALVLAVVATYFAASRPARSITKVPVVAALSGRPAPPTPVHRSAVPGIGFLVVAFVLLGYSGSSAQGHLPELALGLVALVPGVILLSPFCLSALARLGGRSPIAMRLALRDLARYRARSGSALAAISLSVLIAVIIAIVAAARYANVLDYVGPNLASNQLVVYTPNGPGYTPPGVGSTVTASRLQAMNTSAQAIASSLGARDVVELDSTIASLEHAAQGRNWNGSIYVATPSLLRAFGVNASQVDPTADILTMRPGISTLSDMQLIYGIVGRKVLVDPGRGPPAQGPGQGPGAGTGAQAFPCPESDCLANPVILQVGALPSGTSAPNTVITEHAVHQLGLQTQTSGWLIQTARPLDASQIQSARLEAAATGMVIETRSDQPTSAEVINWATAFGVALALAILAMSVGLIRSETAADLRTLAATGASSRTRRTLTATTAGALAFLGALLGTVAGYIGVIGWIRNNSLNGGVTALGNVPVGNLLVILVGMPLVAAAVGWLLAGREPAAMSHQRIE